MTPDPAPDITPLYREEKRWRWGWTGAAVEAIRRIRGERSMTTCWIIHQPDGDGIIGAPDGRTFVWRQERDALAFFGAYVIHRNEEWDEGSWFQIKRMEDADDFFRASDMDGCGAVWYGDYLAEREARKRERAEFDAHPKLLEV